MTNICPWKPRLAYASSEPGPPETNADDGTDRPAGCRALTWAALAAIACIPRWKTTLSDTHRVAVPTTTIATMDASVRGSTCPAASASRWVARRSPRAIASRRAASATASAMAQTQSTGRSGLSPRNSAVRPCERTFETVRAVTATTLRIGRTTRRTCSVSRLTDTRSWTSRAIRRTTQARTTPSPYPAAAQSPLMTPW